MIKVLKSVAETIEMLDIQQDLLRTPVISMYSSRISGIIQDKVFMQIAIDDHMIHRSHCVVGEASVINGKVYNIYHHIHALLKSAEAIQIYSPFTHPEILKILLDLASSTSQKNLKLRFWLTAGPGNMSILPLPKESSFYAIAFPFDPFACFFPVKLHILRLPLTSRFADYYSSTNNVINFLSNLNAQEKGGNFGLISDEAGKVIVGSGKGIWVVKGKTAWGCGEVGGRVTELVRSVLVEEEISVLERRVMVEDFLEADEAFIIEGDSVKAVLEIDMRAIGERGRVTKRLSDELIKDFSNSQHSIEIDYETYS